MNRWDAVEDAKIDPFCESKAREDGRFVGKASEAAVQLGARSGQSGELLSRFDLSFLSVLLN
jgi:hypothetical protein